MKTSRRREDEEGRKEVSWRKGATPGDGRLGFVRCAGAPNRCPDQDLRYDLMLELSDNDLSRGRVILEDAGMGPHIYLFFFLRLAYL
jgi:hypothetical protein